MKFSNKKILLKTLTLLQYKQFDVGENTTR